MSRETDFTQSLYNQCVLNQAIFEEEDRRHEIVRQITKLSDIIAGKVSHVFDINAIKAKALAAIDYDIDMINKLNAYIANNQALDSTYALKTNKNALIFAGAKKILEEDFDLLVTNNFTAKYPISYDKPTVFGGEVDNYMGTSQPNFIQTALFTILYTMDDAHKLTELAPLINYNIYNVDTSPNVQTTKFPPNINLDEISPNFKDWIYYYQDEKSPAMGELLIFNLGYFFGGSREDERFVDKKFKAEDCSSIVAKWTHAPQPFSTIHMEELYNSKCNNEYCEAASKVLIPNTDKVHEGNIFAFRTYDIATDPNMLNSKSGHTGLVTKVFDDAKFETLAYARNMPYFEGFGYNIEDMNEHLDRKYMFFDVNIAGENWHLVNEL